MEPKPLTQEQIAKLTYTITQPEIQGILNYLATRPYHEVFKLVDTLRNVKPNPLVESSDLIHQLVENEAQKAGGQA